MLNKRNPKQKMKETLADAFAKSELWNAQEYITFWAIKEGVNRVSDLRKNYQISHATKTYKCARGCSINIEDQYFAAKNKQAGKKLCVSCMAMILYFLKVWDLPTYQYDYWDDEKRRPHLDENSSHWKDMKDAVENL